MEDFRISSSGRPIHVYLSFRGDEDTCKFTDRLWAALESNDINTFWDDKKLETGESIIPPHLLEAIQESYISIVVFSKNYVASIWCMQELSEIAARINERRHTVLPVFYDVDPSEVQDQSNSYEKVFAKHEERFTANLHKVHRWRLAMTQVANLSGWDLRYDPRSQVIDDILRKVNRKMDRLVYADVDLVGMQSRVEAVEKLLNLGSDDVVQLVGIWGMGGIGKTTLARVLYDRISHHFEASCFLPNVSEVLKRDGLSLEELLCETLEMKNLEIRDIQEGMFLASTKLIHHKTLIILDGVDLLQNLKALSLVVKSNRFGGGSRIIITTRDERVLKVFKVDNIYKLELLTKDEAFQLFCKKAFKCDFPMRGYEEQTNSILEYANGLPLAIVILGSSLFNRSASEWRSTLAKLKKVPNRWIVEVLKKSFDELDQMNKEIFLDIACFFIGKKINYAKGILQNCGFSAEIGIKILIQKSLMTILDQRIQMHGMLQEMGREIVRQECPYEPGKRSRLWLFDDIYHVMQENTATEKVEAIVLNMEDSEGATLRIEALSHMSKLRLLIFHNVNFSGTLTCHSNKLRYVSWHQYPFTCLASSFELHTLVELIMPDSNIIDIWEGRKMLPNLRNMNLRGSKNLIKMPDFRGVPNLEKLDLEGCTELLQLHPSIAELSKLKYLNLRKCINLVSIPNRLFALGSLEILNLACCSKLAYCLDFSAARSLIEVKLLSNQYGQSLAKMLSSRFFLFLFLIPLIQEFCYFFVSLLPKSMFPNARLKK